MISIRGDFESGSVNVLSAKRAGDIRLEIPKDSKACTRQWFYFSVTTEKPETQKISLVNAGKTTYLMGWKGYRAFASYDLQNWFRVDTIFEQGELKIEHQATEQKVYYAYFVPYPLERKSNLIEKLKKSSYVEIEELCKTPLENSIELIKLRAKKKNNKKVWLIARQHPGESMSQWVIEGMLESILNEPKLEQILSEVNFYIVPNMNPDGSQIGNHRTNNAGINLNRVWHSADKIEAPEVFYVREALLKHGVDVFIDLHGDEAIPHNFMMVSGDMKSGNKIKEKLASVNPDFQLVYDYDNDGLDSSESCCQTSCCNSSCNISAKATDFVAENFDAVSLILETSFKELERNGTTVAWDHDGCKRLGKSLWDVITQE
ncbi:M14 family metallopeptidase [Kangiella sediminilitoris]|uniref:Peptidase M14 domain-containing protein n=1 Tax=Kangiella sediminilitoris TaxID=1144748 RepID=A0A1B3BDN8_9GAMM|nr:M14-type cytosolic carboxypeptidase [Kangiella sediminilitoris]AOE50910.1 hypothetical protein KS2013_2205 [Kangiella sediminilitoris]